MIRLDPTIFRVCDRETLVAHCQSMHEKVTQNSNIDFTGMLAFANYLSAGPMDVTTTVIPKDYMEAEPEDKMPMISWAS